MNPQSTDKLFSAEIVPWALPGEEIPLRVCWSKSTRVDFFKITLPEEFEVVDYLNVSEISIEDDKITVTPTNDAPVDPNYIGIIVKYNAIPKDLHHPSDLSIEAHCENELIWKEQLKCNIFRPLVEMMQAPSQVELLDDESKAHIPIQLRYTGFGEVRLTIESTIGGNIVSTNETILSEILTRMCETGLISEEETLSNAVHTNGIRKNIHISPKYVQELATELEEVLVSGNLQFEEIDASSVSELREQLEMLKGSDNGGGMLFGTVQNLLLDIMVDLLDRHPAEDVTVANTRSRVRARMRAPVETLVLNISYQDLANNKYDPVSVSIRIVDSRKRDRDFTFELPITIEKVEHRPFRDVVMMGRDIGSQHRAVDNHESDHAEIGMSSKG